MKKYPLTVKQCISKLRNKASNLDYAEVKGLLTWSAGYLEDLLEYHNAHNANLECMGDLPKRPRIK